MHLKKDAVCEILSVALELTPETVQLLEEWKREEEGNDDRKMLAQKLGTLGVVWK